MVFKFTKVVPEGHTKWFTIPVTSSVAGAAAKVSASFDTQSVQQGLDRVAAERKHELAAAADLDSDTIYYVIGAPTDHLQGSSMPVTAYFKTRTSVAMLTATERKMMLHVGACYVEEGMPKSWFIEAWGPEAGMLVQLVEEKLMAQTRGLDNTFRITPDGLAWIEANRADLVKQP